MSTEELSRFLNFKKQRGAISALSVFIGTILLLLRLSNDQVIRLKEMWWILSIPSILVLISWMFTAYISEIRSRTRIEEKIQRSLAILATNFERLFANQIDEKTYSMTRFDIIDDRLKSIYHIIEKRNGYKSGKDTEKFLHK